MTTRQKELARHALGLRPRNKISYRNRFVAGPGHSDYQDWLEMVEQGNAFRRTGGEMSGGDDIFWLTDVGAKLALNSGEKLDPEDFPNVKVV